MFFNTQDYPIGLDISDLSLKFVQLGKNGRKIYIQSFGKVFLENGIVENGYIKNMEVFSEKVKELLDNPKFGKISSRRVVVCLPEPKTFIKIINIARSKKLNREYIEEEIKNYIPMSLEDTYYDWQVISREGENRTVLVGVSPKIFVDQYIQAMQKVKLSLVATEIESISIVRALLREEAIKPIETKKTYGIIDIGASRSSMFVYSGNAILFNVSIPISGERITEKISKELNVNRKKAELAKIVCGVDKTRCEGIVEAKISESIKKVLLRISNVIDFHLEHFSRYNPIEEIIISGGGGNITGLDKEIEKFTGIRSYIGNPFVNIDIVSEPVLNKMFSEHKLSKNESLDSKTFSILQNDSLTYCTAIGLALREILKERAQ